MTDEIDEPLAFDPTLKLVTLTELAHLLRTAPTTVAGLIRGNHIKAKLIGNRWRITRAEAERVLASVDELPAQRELTDQERTALNIAARRVIRNLVYLQQGSALVEHDDVLKQLAEAGMIAREIEVDVVPLIADIALRMLGEAAYSRREMSHKLELPPPELQISKG